MSFNLTSILNANSLSMKNAAEISSEREVAHVYAILVRSVLHIYAVGLYKYAFL